MQDQTLPEPAAMPARLVQHGMGVRDTAGWWRPVLSVAPAGGRDVTITLYSGERLTLPGDRLVDTHTADALTAVLVARAGYDPSGALAETMRAGYVPASCGHMVAESEHRAGFDRCEHCPTPVEVTAVVGIMRSLLAAGWVYDSTTPMSGGRTSRVLLHPSGRQIEASTWPEGITDLELTGLSLAEVAGAIEGAGLVDPADDVVVSEVIGAAVQLVAAWRAAASGGSAAIAAVDDAEAALAATVVKMTGEVVPDPVAPAAAAFRAALAATEYVRVDPVDSAPLPSGVDGWNITGRDAAEYVITFDDGRADKAIKPLTVLAPCSAQDIADAIERHLAVDANTDYWEDDEVVVDLATGRATVTTSAGYRFATASITGPGVTR